MSVSMAKVLPSPSPSPISKGLSPPHLSSYSHTSPVNTTSNHPTYPLSPRDRSQCVAQSAWKVNELLTYWLSLPHTETELLHDLNDLINEKPFLAANDASKHSISHLQRKQCHWKKKDHKDKDLSPSVSPEPYLKARLTPPRCSKRDISSNRWTSRSPSPTPVSPSSSPEPNVPLPPTLKRYSENVFSCKEPPSTPSSSPVPPTSPPNELLSMKRIRNCSDIGDTISETLSVEKIRVSNLEAQDEYMISVEVVPPFYFPLGNPALQETNLRGEQLQLIKDIFKKHGGSLSQSEFLNVTAACAFPRYWNVPLFRACNPSRSSYNSNTTFSQFFSLWKRMFSEYRDDDALFFFLLRSKGRTGSGLSKEDLKPIVSDITASHPGLAFLRDTPEFVDRYTETVVVRMFYDINRSWSGSISLPELRRSHLLGTLIDLENEEDINKINNFFSYEHFYVIYCKFWELDTDHDLLITKVDFQRHDGESITYRMIDRIFSGAVCRHSRAASIPSDLITYEEFVWFLISEEDKTSRTSIEYWFRCMDLDGDGRISMFEMEYFFEEQLHRMDSYGVEVSSFEDCLCQVMDMVKPQNSDYIQLSDLKRCKLSTNFFNVFFNLPKFLAFEQRDSHGDNNTPQVSDWERYAMIEYDRLAMEEDDADEDQWGNDDEDRDWSVHQRRLV